MRIDLNIPRGEKQRLVLDHFNSALRKVSNGSTGSAQFHEDGSFESSTTSEFPVNGEQVVLTWTVIKSSDGTLQAIEVTSAESRKKKAVWNDAVNTFVRSVLTAALTEKREKFFRRRFFHYIGAQLDGEYWLPGFRFAPVYPDDPEPTLLNAERVVSIDMNVEAIDKHNADSLADEGARRYASRLSLLLNVGLYQPQAEHRWVLPTGDGKAPKESERYQLGFSKQNLHVDRMPAKAELCELGKYSGSLEAKYIVAGELRSLPPESRKILRGIDNSEPRVAESFDCCARLYQVASVVGPLFPSVGLAYRVAAVEAITQGNPEFNSFSDFVRKNVRPRQDLDKALDFLYASARSAHFHAGKFLMGEFTATRYFDWLMDSDFIERQEIQSIGYELTREAIITWLSRVVPELQPTEETDSLKS